MTTTRLLKAVLPAACLWTGLRPVEGFDYDSTLKELRTLYPADDSDSMETDEDLLPQTVPESIREMVTSKNAIVSLGSMIWLVDYLYHAMWLLTWIQGIYDSLTLIRTSLVWKTSMCMIRWSEAKVWLSMGKLWRTLRYDFIFPSVRPYWLHHNRSSSTTRVPRRDHYWSS